VRIIATSNRDLLAYIEKGAFRQDLYYRLNVFPVHVPALRDRVEEITPLAEHFLARYTRKLGVKVAGFSESARSAMLQYRWPGNVRELQNTIERAIILTEPGRMVSAAAMGIPSQGGVHYGDSLPAVAAPENLTELPGNGTPNGVEEPLEGPGSQSGSVLNIAELEKHAIKSALEKTGGNRTKAAELLGISIRTLRNKLQEYRGSDDLVGVESGAAE